ncbi:putative transcription factor MYB-HB-like family [Arabidopsis thaliana]
MNQSEDDKMKKTYQKKNIKVVSTSKYLKKSNIVKVKWTESEDIKLKEIMALGPTKKWTKVPKKFERRTGKQCRERWYDHLRPNIKDTKYLVPNGTRSHSNFRGARSDNNIKNHWNTTKRRVQNKRGGTVNLVGNNILENYIRCITINNEDFLKTDGSYGEPTNIESDDDSKDMLYGEMNLSLETITTQTTKPLTNASTTLPYVPMPEENYTVEDCESLEDILEVLRWWE